MDLFSGLILALALGYFFTALYLLAQPLPEKYERTDTPSVAVLIAMRDEAENIEACMAALKNLSYPQSALRVHILDDRSNDNSLQLAEAATADLPNFFVHRIDEDRNGLAGKMNVIAQGIDLSDAEFIFITDADCQVPEDWIQTQLAYFTPQTAMVGGLVSLLPPAGQMNQKNDTRFFHKIQALDWLFLQELAIRSSAADKPLSILGNNFAFRRTAYQEVGGYEALGFSVTEDFSLMRALVKSGNWQIRHTKDLSGTVYSRPVDGLGDFLLQRHRWATGGRGASLWTYFLIGLAVLSQLTIPLIFAVRAYQPTAALAIGLIIGINYIIIKRAIRIPGLEKLRNVFWPWQIFYLCYLILFSLWMLVPQRVRWKNRRF